MIQPLRVWHRRAVFALAAALPVVFAAGLLARKSPAPPNAPIAADTHVRWRRALTVPLGTAQVVARFSEDRTWLEIRPGEGVLEPDVLVYASAAAAPSGNSLPADARLLGSMAQRLHAPDAGYAVLYSLAHQTVIGSIRLGDLP